MFWISALVCPETKVSLNNQYTISLLKPINCVAHTFSFKIIVIIALFCHPWWGLFFLRTRTPWTSINIGQHDVMVLTRDTARLAYIGLNYHLPNIFQNIWLQENQMKKSAKFGFLFKYDSQEIKMKQLLMSWICFMCLFSFVRRFCSYLLTECSHHLVFVDKLIIFYDIGVKCKRLTIFIIPCII